MTLEINHNKSGAKKQKGRGAYPGVLQVEVAPRPSLSPGPGAILKAEGTSGLGRNVMCGLAFPKRFSRESALSDGEDV
jgi:hypothetical protein